MKRQRIAWVAAAFLLGLTACRTTPRETRRGNVVTINSDNVLVVNGKKVFPIGFTLGPPPGAKTPSGKNGMKELADAGGTFMRTGAQHQNWSQKTIEQEKVREAAAARAGLYCWINLYDLARIGGNATAKKGMLERVVNEFKDNPGLLLWKGVDEPEWGKAKIPPMVRSRDIIHHLDPNHPVAVIQAPRGTVETLKPYNATGDITGADIYPISYPPGKHSLLTNKEISMVGDYTRRMMEVSGGKMPVWMVLQIAWSGVVKSGTTLRFPTFAEERFMTYEAIINGARGLVYFGGNVEQALTPEDAKLGWNWNFWYRVLRPVIEEVGEHSPLEPALVAPESKLPIHLVNGAGIEYCVRQSGHDLYLLACKREGATIQATFENLPVPDGKAPLMYESPREVSVAGGKFTDWFGPFEVHVYHFVLSNKSSKQL